MSYSKCSDQKMTPEDVADWVGDIESYSSDPELAHAEEDKMRGDVLAAIRDGRAIDPIGCAREALKSDEIDFPRWCA